MDVFCYSGHLRVLAGFLPEYYIHSLSFCPLSPILAVRCALAAAGIPILLFSTVAKRRQRAVRAAV